MVNKVILIGNVGKDPEIKEFDNGNKVANLSLATSETWKDKQGEKQTATEWHNLSVFGNTVGVVEKYVKKGDRLYIEGSIKTRTWESEGVTKYAKDIKVHNLTMLGGTAEKKKSDDLDSINDSLF